MAADPTRSSSGAKVCMCGHPRSGHADCGHGPCRSNISIALWHDSNDRKTVPCRCSTYHEPIETVEVDPNG